MPPTSPRLWPRTWMLWLGLAAGASGIPRTAWAIEPMHVMSTNPEAQQHNVRANELYTAGKYREAIAELELALAIDPNGKNLVANLATVHEKMGDIDDAIAYAQRYLQMDPTPQERAKYEKMLTRLEGAKAEVLAKQAEELEKLKQADPAYGLLPVAPPEPPRHGRVDGATITTLSLSGIGLMGGAVFGVKALIDNKANSGANTATDNGGVVNQQHQAHYEAIAADAGFGLFGVAGIASAILYFGRTENKETASWSDRAQVMVAPSLHGGSVKMSVRF